MKTLLQLGTTLVAISFFVDLSQQGRSQGPVESSLNSPSSPVAGRLADDAIVSGETTPSPAIDAFSSNDAMVLGESSFLPSSSSFLRSELSDSRLSETDAMRSTLNFNEFPKDFTNGLTIRQERWGLKFGGYVKADLIHDFDAIDSTDFFDPATIPINAPERSNSRFHARQTRLNMDARWLTESGDPFRILVEGDFFGAGDSFRLRHAYGEYQGWLIGQTWSTLTHRAALPNTLDQVGDVASVGRRQAQVRWSRSWMEKRYAFSAAIEDSNVLVDESLAAFGSPRSIAPDFVCRLRFATDDMQLQLGSVVRRLGFQPTGLDVLSKTGAGLNLTGYADFTSASRVYGGILWGTGIGDYRELPDIALLSPTQGTALRSLSWYSGVHHQWSQRWTSNVTYSQGDVDNTSFQSPSAIQRLQYLAANLIWQPTPYTFAGTEYLWGLRRDRNDADAEANRVMISFGFLLP